MAQDYIEVQNYAEVQQIDNRREIRERLDNQVVKQTNAMSNINDQLESISSTIDNIQVGDVDLSEVTNRLEEIDTTSITEQNQNIIETLNDQQNQINSIEEKLNIILNKIDEM